VVLATWLGGKKIKAPAFEFAAPLRPVAAVGLWDRFGLWTVLAVVLLGLAYGYPVIQLVAHPRYGSPAFRPF